MGVDEVVSHRAPNSNGVRKAVIPAAGVGTRFLPFSKSVPKELVPIVDKPLIQYVVEEAVESGVEDVIVVISRGKRAIMEHFEPAPHLHALLKKKGDATLLESLSDLPARVNLRFVYQEQPLGLGHAVLCAQSEIGDASFAVLLGDNLIDSGIPATRQLIDVYDQYPGCILAIGEVNPVDVGRFGIVNGKPLATHNSRPVFRISDLVEKPAPGSVDSRLGIYGRYVFSPEIFSHIQAISTQSDSEVQLTDAISSYCRAGNAVHGYCFEGRHFDAGHKLGFLEANVAFGLKHPEIARQFRLVLESELAATPA